MKAPRKESLMSRSTRRTASIGIAAAALALTSACGGSSGSSSAGGSTGASAAASSGASTGASTGGNHFAPGSSVDAASVRQMFSSAMASASTVHVTMKMTGSIAMSGSGDMDLKSKPLEASLKLSSSQLGATGSSTVQMLMVDNAMYLQMAALGDKYVKMSLTDKNSPLASMGLDSLDPAALFDKFGDAIDGGTYVGKETVDGTPTDHYKFTIDTSAVASAFPSLASAAASAMPASETVDVWFDSDGRYKQMKMNASGENVTEVFSDWGKKVSVTAPPASKVTDMSSLGSALSGATGGS